MAQFKLEQLDDAGAVVHVGAATLAATDIARFFTAYRSLYGQVDSGALNQDGTPVSPPVMRDLTDAEVWAIFTDGLLKGVIANVQSQERAVAQAALTPTPVLFTPVANH